MNMQGMQHFRSTTTTELAIKILAAIAFWPLGRRLIGQVVAIPKVVKNPVPKADVLDHNEAIPRMVEKAGRSAPAPVRITRLMSAG